MAKAYCFAGRRARVDVERRTDEAGEVYWQLCVRRGALDRIIRLPDDEMAAHRRALVEAYGESA